MLIGVNKMEGSSESRIMQNGENMNLYERILKVELKIEGKENVKTLKSAATKDTF